MVFEHGGRECHRNSASSILASSDMIGTVHSVKASCKSPFYPKFKANISQYPKFDAADPQE